MGNQQPGVSGRAALAGCLVAHGSVKQRPLQRIEARQHRGNLGQKRVGKECGDLLIAAAARVAHELADVDLEGVGEALQRSQGGDGFAVLNLGDVGARNLHATGELALAKVARLSDLADLARNLQTSLSRRLNERLRGYRLRTQYHRLLKIERLVASSAEGVAGAVLHQGAMFTAHDFARVKTHKCGCHRLCAECQSVVSGVLLRTTICVTFGGMNHNCQVRT